MKLPVSGTPSTFLEASSVFATTKKRLSGSTTYRWFDLCTLKYQHCGNNHQDQHIYQTGVWEKFTTPKGAVTPRGRRGHTAVVFQDSMWDLDIFVASVSLDLDLSAKIVDTILEWNLICGKKSFSITCFFCFLMIGSNQVIFSLVGVTDSKPPGTFMEDTRT